MGVRRRWRASRFNAHIRSEDGGLVVFNSFSSALLEFRDDTADAVEEVLAGRRRATGEMASFLKQQGILVPEDDDELEHARALHERPFNDEKQLGLTLLANENCNFRCVYCYEDFKKNRMKPEVADGVVALVRRRVPTLRRVSIAWFGGEPLLSFDVIEDVCKRVRAICQEHGVAYASQMTTNGYLLDAERAARCIAAGITRYQVTLDGPPETHNRARVLAGGGPTFDRILANLRNLRDNARGFHLSVRVNFSPENLPRIPEFVRFLGGEFGGDPRFSLRFHPVGKWGGPKDDQLIVCDHHSGEEESIELMTAAMDAGFTLDAWKQSMRPYGSSCYAASPRHFVIGSDGIVYKCTVVFNDPRNQVGQLDADGDLNLRPDLVRLWTRSGEETDTGCQSCGFRPACQGNLCPLERINGDEKRCPTIKTHLHRLLPLIARDAKRALPVVS
jgi:uncharacterized protein